MNRKTFNFRILVSWHEASEVRKTALKAASLFTWRLPAKSPPSSTVFLLKIHESLPGTLIRLNISASKKLGVSGRRRCRGVLLHPPGKNEAEKFSGKSKKCLRKKTFLQFFVPPKVWVFYRPCFLLPCLLYVWGAWFWEIGGICEILGNRLRKKMRWWYACETG